MKIIPSLELCMETARNPRVKKILLQIQKSVATVGATLHEAMRDTGAFDDLTLGLVRAGEGAGFLDRAFQQINSIAARGVEIKRKIVGVMIYPAIVITIATGAIYLLMLKTVPVFVGMYAEAKMKLPIPTQALITASNITTTYPVAIGLACGALVFLTLKTPAIYRRWYAIHGLILRLPGIGTIMKKNMQASFARTLSDMLAAQTRMLDSLSYCRSASTNMAYKGAIARAILTVSHGGTLASAFSKDVDIFGSLIVKALIFGEQTGRIEEMLSPMANALDRELSEYVDHIKVIFEPVLTLLIGGVTLFVMMALFIPIFSMSKLL